MVTVGYARVSSAGQSLEVQLKKLREFGCEEMFQEKISGSMSSRPAFQECLRYLRKGDTLVITRLDRLARSMVDIHRMLHQFDTEGVGFVAIDQPMIDTTTSEGRLISGVLAAVAEFELHLRKERQIEGITRAKSNGVRFGRRSSLTTEQIVHLRQKRKEGSTVQSLMEEFEISKATLYRFLKRDELDDEIDEKSNNSSMQNIQSH